MFNLVGNSSENTSVHVCMAAAAKRAQVQLVHAKVHAYHVKNVRVVISLI